MIVRSVDNVVDLSEVIERVYKVKVVTFDSMNATEFFTNNYYSSVSESSEDDSVVKKTIVPKRKSLPIESSSDDDICIVNEQTKKSKRRSIVNEEISIEFNEEIEREINEELEKVKKRQFDSSVVPMDEMIKRKKLEPVIDLTDIPEHINEPKQVQLVFSCSTGKLKFTVYDNEEIQKYCEEFCAKYNIDKSSLTMANGLLNEYMLAGHIEGTIHGISKLKVVKRINVQVKYNNVCITVGVPEKLSIRELLEKLKDTLEFKVDDICAVESSEGGYKRSQFDEVLMIEEDETFYIKAK